jgi:cation transporter-like permease
VFGALAVILLALAAFSVLSFRISTRSRRGPQQGLHQPSEGESRLQGFLVVGAAALVLCALVVVVVGVAGDRSGRAEAVAMFGLFTYAVYLTGALVLHRWAGRRR